MWEAFTFCAEGAEQIFDLNQIFWQKSKPKWSSKSALFLSQFLVKHSNFRLREKISKNCDMWEAFTFCAEGAEKMFRFKSNILAKIETKMELKRCIVSFSVSCKTFKFSASGKIFSKNGEMWKPLHFTPKAQRKFFRFKSNILATPQIETELQKYLVPLSVSFKKF